MSSIIEFRCRPAPVPASVDEGVAHAATRSADIIIFPGVRIERWNEAEADAKPKRRQRGRAKRDRLELPEL
ncbi:MAG: hypothetical protein AB7K67_13140 [Hyphomicrobiaceae bacterium]|jgi:hypothetical protein